MKRGTYAAATERNAPILERIREIKADHPFWGYRRVWAHLKYIDDISISQNRAHRLMKAHGLLVAKNMKLKAIRKPHTRKPQTRKPKPERSNQWWGIDMTKIMIEDYGWVYVTIVIDWYTKKVVGHHAGEQSKAWHWLKALNVGINRQFPNGVRGHDLNLMSDNGCQPTSISFIRDCKILGIKQAFTSYNNPKGNADTERFMRTLKEELVWITEWRNPTAFFQALDVWIEHYNSSYLHSALGYQSPTQFEKKQQLKNMQNTLLKNAC